MRNWIVFLVSVTCLFIGVSGCNNHMATTVAVVRTDGLTNIMGKLVLTVGGIEGSHITYWQSRNIVICRIDHKFGKEECKAGRAYRIHKDGRLKLVEVVDMTKSDQDLAASFGVHVAENDGYLVVTGEELR